jgi:hypothetical protein
LIRFLDDTDNHMELEDSIDDKANLFEVENTDADIPIRGGIRKPE